jgi:hypothetical protein
MSRVEMNKPVAVITAVSVMVLLGMTIVRGVDDLLSTLGWATLTVFLLVERRFSRRKSL